MLIGRVKFHFNWSSPFHGIPTRVSPGILSTLKKILKKILSLGKWASSEPSGSIKVQIQWEVKWIGFGNGSWAWIVVSDCCQWMASWLQCERVVPDGQIKSHGRIWCRPPELMLRLLGNGCFLLILQGLGPSLIHLIQRAHWMMQKKIGVLSNSGDHTPNFRVDI